MNKGKPVALWITLVLIIGGGIAIVASKQTPVPIAATVTRPALSVSSIQPSIRDMPLTLNANGSVAAWQEAIIGAEVSDLRLNEVRAEVGEAVRKGQVLAVFANESVLADVAQSKAVLAEAEANLTDAHLNADRARQAGPSGALSKQQITQYLTTEKTAKAKVEYAKAQLDSQLLRLRHTRVIASDDGVISSRTATLGAVATPGQELFRFIRQNRLEWQAEVTAAEMAQLKPGIAVSVVIPNVATVEGKVRFLASTLDTQNRNGLVYVDLPNAAAQGLRSGMFAQGEFQLGSQSALTIPQEALSLREGFSYVFRLGKQSKDQAQVTQVKVQLGRRSGDSYEILSGLKPEDKLVASGASFLADGDSVRLVQR
ncbi:efflux RND transporter periplasmic adaptor subunit [Methyloglobulus sp.]|uniref:efflux RND transporter periplasmic adaptor subunit n=1 Tax=Methyloglobulus sp. TaxID=2518622 RepID=UPI0032B82449